MEWRNIGDITYEAHYYSWDAAPRFQGKVSRRHRSSLFDGSEELYDMKKDPNEYTNLASNPETKALKKKLAAFLPMNPAKPAAGSRARLVELKEDGFVYWENKRIEKGAKIPGYE
jgi:hypothetical protein